MNNTKVTKRNASSYRSVKTEIRKSNTEGRGLFAKDPICEGEIVSVRGGHILTRQMEEKLENLMDIGDIRLPMNLFLPHLVPKK